MRAWITMAFALASCGPGEEKGCEQACGDAQECSTMTCRGENYDVDNNASNCCEVADSPTGNHLRTAESATYIGSFSCNDVPSAQNITGRIPSDQRIHTNPVMNGFDPVTGAAPDYVRLMATGGFCVNDLDLSLSMAGSTIPSCYHLSVIVGNGSYDCQTNSAGTCTIAAGPGSYPDGAELYIKVAKTCGVDSPDNAAYTVTGHL